MCFWYTFYSCSLKHQMDLFHVCIWERAHEKHAESGRHLPPPKNNLKDIFNILICQNHIES